MAIHYDPPLDEQLPQVNASKVSDRPAFEPVPTISIHMSSLNGKATVRALPDSGADISVGGKDLLEHLHEHPDNLLSLPELSMVSSCALSASYLLR